MRINITLKEILTTKDENKIYVFKRPYYKSGYNYLRFIGDEIYWFDSSDESLGKININSMTNKVFFRDRFFHELNSLEEAKSKKFLMMLELLK